MSSPLTSTTLFILTTIVSSEVDVFVNIIRLFERLFFSSFVSNMWQQVDTKRSATEKAQHAKVVFGVCCVGGSGACDN